MFRLVLVTLGVLVLISTFMLSSLFGSDVSPQDGFGSIYDFKMKSLSGEEINFSKYKGKNLLIVNTASKCGYTYQYADLEKLYDQLGGKAEILGFPANNFLWQEPGSNEEIAEFCQKNYGVKFQMFEKISVKGKDKHPLYRWLEAKSGKSPSWNFNKYVINKNGEVVGFFPAKVNPLDDQILSLLRKE
ncbi:MAG: glutathione peroxidase [Cyclobacteriaceae bacterium]|nr:glutathione peroxidase [Cyclobacteriaceae bacterium]